MARSLRAGDLMNVVIAAEQTRCRLAKEPLRHSPSALRRWVETLFNVPGLFIGLAMRLLPWSLRTQLHMWMCGKMGGHIEPLHPSLGSYAAKARALAVQLEKQAGHSPALLIFTSHPPTTGGTAWLRFHLLKHGLVIANDVLRALGNPRRHPQCLLAIDPYALDTLPPWVAGLYAGVMQGIFMAYDREAHTQTWLQRWILKGSAYSEVGWELLRRLKEGTPVLMMVGGGLPQNARLLHTCREFIRNHWPKGKAGRLAFEKAFLEEITFPHEGGFLSVSGTISPARLQALQSWAAAKGFLATPEQWDTFRNEFLRSVPYRRRLFRVLRDRLIKKGVPILFIGIDDLADVPYAKLSGPWGWPTHDLKVEGKAEEIIGTAFN